MSIKADLELKRVILGRTAKGTSPNASQPPSTEKRKGPFLGLSTDDGGVVATDGETHLITVSSHDSDKDRSVIIPNLLTYPGPVVVLDPTGEKYAVTARARRDMGHTVLRLDPFGVVEEQSDALNPLDLLSLPGSDVETHAQVLAEMLFRQSPLSDHWEMTAFALLGAVLGYLASVPEKRTISGLTSTFTSDDVVYNLAVVLDTIGKKIPPTAYTEISTFLQRVDAERTRILGTISAHLKGLTLLSKEVSKTLDRSSVPLTDIVEGKPISIYLIVPPTKLRWHRDLLRLWIGTVLHCITARRVPGRDRTLFILDDCAELEYFAALEAAMTLRRGYGLQIWTFWQNLSQLRSLYPASWPTMVDNCGVVQILGGMSYSASAEMAALLDVEVDDVRLLQSEEQILCLRGKCEKVMTLDYPTDPMFAGLFDTDSGLTNR